MDAEQLNKLGGFVRVEVIAKIFGFDSARRVQQLTQDGVISTVEIEEGGRKQRRYDLIPTVTRYIIHLREKARGRSDRESELREQKLKAEIALKESQGELHRLKTDIAAGKYIAVEDVEGDYERFFSTFKNFAMGIPARIADRVGGCVEPLETKRIEQELLNDMRERLRAFAAAGRVKSAE